MSSFWDRVLDENEPEPDQTQNEPGFWDRVLDNEDPENNATSEYRVSPVLVDSEDLEPAPGVTPPVVTDETFPLLDDDAGECTTISANDVAPLFGGSYVDNYLDNVVDAHIPAPTLWGEIDAETLTVTLANGASYSVSLESIELDGGPTAVQYRKTNDIIFPADESGQILLNATNLPNLAYVKTFTYRLWQELQAERLEFAEIVYSFQVAVEGDLGDVIKELKRREGGFYDD